MMKPLFVSDDLYRHRLLCFVVETLHHLSERAFPDDLAYLVAIGDVVVENLDVAPVFVVVAFW